MSEQQNERILAKDDSDLFQLVERLTDEQPPEVEYWNDMEEVDFHYHELPDRHDRREG